MFVLLLLPCKHELADHTICDGDNELLFVHALGPLQTTRVDFNCSSLGSDKRSSNATVNSKKGEGIVVGPSDLLALLTP